MRKTKYGEQNKFYNIKNSITMNPCKKAKPIRQQKNPKCFNEIGAPIRRLARIEVVKTHASALMSLFVHLVEKDYELDTELLNDIDEFLVHIYNRYMPDETQDIENHCDNNPCD